MLRSIPHKGFFDMGAAFFCQPGIYEINFDDIVKIQINY
jgi:hypothetical protein